MSTKSEPQVLAEVIDFNRQLTRFYLSKLKGIDMQHEFEFDGKRFNSPYWIIGHLAWAQNNLILKGTYGEKIRNEWLPKFKIGGKIDDYSALPNLKDLLATFKEIHEKSLQHVAKLSHEDLNKPNAINFGFEEEKTVRSIIQHQIRHEGVHTGHLSWICKMHSITTF